MYEIKELFSNLYFVEFGDGVESHVMFDGLDAGDVRIMNMLGHNIVGIENLISTAERLAGRIPAKSAKDNAHERIGIATRLLGDSASESSRWAAEAILNMTIVYSKVHGAQDD